MLYGQRDEPYVVISQLGSRLEAALAPERVLPAIVETTAHALKLPYVAIVLKQQGISAITASYGEIRATNDELIHLPLIYQAEKVGEMLIASRAPGETFTPADRRLLENLARQAGVAVYGVRLTIDLQRLATELQHARTRLVTTREEERRRLRRDLHDGIGSVLASLNLRTGAIRSLLVPNPATAQILLEEQQATIRTAIADIRRLVYDLRPPSLDELGLLGALNEQAAHAMMPTGAAVDQEALPRLQIAIEPADDLPFLPAAIEVAAYRIVQEALTNVVRHAHATICLVQLSVVEESLHIEVSDDGVGITPGQQAGVGLLSMRERAEEVGGRCSIQPGSRGGTQVCASLPFPTD